MKSAVTVSLTTTFLASARSGRVIARGVVTGQQGRMVTLTGEVVDGDGTVCVVGQASFMYLPEAGEFIGSGRLRDWFRLLSLEVESQHFGCYRPAVHSEQWLQRYAWMDRAGARWWPIFGSVYFFVAVKRRSPFLYYLL